MKTFLNVLGILSLLGAVVLLAVPEIGPYLAGAALAEAAIFLTLAKMLDLLEQHVQAAKAHRLLERDYWKLTASYLAPQGGAAEPTKWYVRLGDETKGPFSLEQVRALRDKGAFGNETLLATEGSKEWKRAGEALA